MKLRTHLALGRVSNLPTVWSNVLAAAVLGAAAPPGIAVLAAMLGCSALYLGGMYLNDALDAEIDTLERPERPIPSGKTSRLSVILWANAWFIAGLGCLAAARLLAPAAQGTVAWLMATSALIATIVVYDMHHKGNPWGPLLMAACRALVYLAAGLALAGGVSGALLAGAMLVLFWVAGLTAFAKQEGGGARTSLPWPIVVLALPSLAALYAVVADPAAVTPLILLLVALSAFAIRHAQAWMRRKGPGDFPAAIGLLIAGISLVDALAIAAAGHALMALLATGCAGLTLLGQRFVAGT